MRRLLVVALAVAVVAATGCALDLDHNGPTIELFDNGVRMSIIACPDSGLLVCNAVTATDTASATLDGDAVDLPTAPLDECSVADPDTDVTGIPWVMYGLAEGGFELELASPRDPAIVVAIDGATTAVAEAPAVAVVAPQDVQRSAGPTAIAWTSLPGAIAGVDTGVYVVTTCGADSTFFLGGYAGSQSQLAVDLSEAVPANATACTHTIEVQQIVGLDAKGPATVTMTRIGLATIQSEP